MVAEPPPPDMKASILCGLEFLRQHYAPGESDAWLVAPADMPRLPSSAIDRLVEACHEGQDEILVPCPRGRRGHPNLLPGRAAAGGIFACR